MAEEKKPGDDVNESPVSASDDLINLEDLVKNIDTAEPAGAPAPSVGIVRSMSDPMASETPGAAVGVAPTDAPVSAASESAVATSPGATGGPGEVLESLSPEKVDEILSIEAPELMAQIQEMRADKSLPTGDEAIDKFIEVETIEALNKANKPKTLRARIRAQVSLISLKFKAVTHGIADFAKRIARDGKGYARETALQLKSKTLVGLKALRINTMERIKRAAAVPNSQKLAFLMGCVALGLAVFAGYQTWRGKLLPEAKREWIASFADVADGTFSYKPDDPFEDFNDSLHHPEFVVLVERLVVNLKRENPNDPRVNELPSPMAAFDLYLQTDNQESAVEIKDRLVEVRDTIGRAVERLTYSALASEEGKAKLKLIIRKDLNEKLIKGRIRRVYLKTLILNPDETAPKSPGDSDEPNA